MKEKIFEVTAKNFIQYINNWDIGHETVVDDVISELEELQVLLGIED